MPLILTYAQLAERGITLSKCQLWRLERAGRFPKRIRVTPGRVGWLSGEITEYLANRIAEREAA